jgi:glutathione S-transferase
MEPLVLHDDPTSGNSYKIKLTASILSIPLQTRTYHVVNGDTRTPQFLNEVSSYGKIPVLEIGASTFLPESNAACYYLADITKSSTLIPSDPLQRAEMLRWMFFEQNQHETNIATLRFWLKYVGKENLDESRKAQLEGKRITGRAILDCMDEHLSKNKSGWFVGEVLTLADIVLFGYTHVAHESGFNLIEWPNVSAWCDKVTTVDGFVPMEADT